jgi:hypothetical protein
MRRSRIFGTLLASAGLLVAGAVRAEPILGADPELDALAATYERQQDTFARAENGQNLDAFIKPDQIQLVKDFFGQEKDFKTFSGKHPFEVIERYDEHGDMGNFSGVASVGLAARLLVLRRDKAPAADVARARDACVRAARTWHVFGAIAGPGAIARGVRRVAPEGAEPALPGPAPELIPLKDGAGNALPAKKVDSWRAPVAPGFDGWVWTDNSSKDQVAGYALAVLWLWDALHLDAEAPKAVVDDLAQDLARFAKELMKVVPELGVDLCVRDADGRLTTFGDLNSRLLSGTSGKPFPESSGLQNGFNAALAMGIVRAAIHVTGDATLRAYYANELVNHREYPRHMVATAPLMYQDESTNFSNVNMMAIALATLGRVESDPNVRARLSEMIDKFWDAGDSRSAVHVEQPWFDVIVAGFGGSPRPDVPGRMRAALLGYAPAPTFQRDRVNCDDGEIAAGSCLAIDGKTTLTVAAKRGHGGAVVATAPLALAIRPDTNFAWRSDPFGVNDGASNRLNPRGDWLAAYWLGRLLDRDPTKNVLPSDLRIPPPEDAGSSSGDDPAGPSSADSSDDGGGCGCAIPRARLPVVPALVALAVALGCFGRRLRGRRDVSDGRRAP